MMIRVRQHKKKYIVEKWDEVNRNVADAEEFSDQGEAFARAYTRALVEGLLVSPLFPLHDAWMAWRARNGVIS